MINLVQLCFFVLNKEIPAILLTSWFFQVGKLTHLKNSDVSFEKN